jgi:hypothetical protein
MIPMVTCNGKVEQRVGGGFVCKRCGKEYSEEQQYDVCTNTVNNKKGEKDDPVHLRKRRQVVRRQRSS